MTVANTSSAPVPIQTVAASAVTYVGQPATSHVTLVYLLECRCYRRVDMDGTLDATAFSIPLGQVLMITDVDWSETGGASGGVAGRTASFLLLFGSTPVLQSEAAFNSDLIAGNTEHLTGGPQVDAGATENVQQANLATLGIRNLAGIPNVIGPFCYAAPGRDRVGRT